MSQEKKQAHCNGTRAIPPITCWLLQHTDFCLINLIGSWNGDGKVGRERESISKQITEHGSHCALHTWIRTYCWVWTTACQKSVWTSEDTKRPENKTETRQAQPSAVPEMCKAWYVAWTKQSGYGENKSDLLGSKHYISTMGCRMR